MYDIQEAIKKSQSLRGKGSCILHGGTQTKGGNCAGTLERGGSAMLLFKGLEQPATTRKKEQRRRDDRRWGE